MSATPEIQPSFFKRYMIPIVLIDLCIVLSIINRFTNLTSEVLMPQFGVAAQNVLGRGIILLTLGLLLLWLLVTRQVGLKPKLCLFGLVALLVGAAAVSVREIENTGDNNYRIRYRWQPTQDQRLAEYQKGNNQTQSSEDEQPDSASATSQALDSNAPRYTDFLGPKRDGVVTGPGLVTDLKQQPPREVWRRPAGGGYASFVIAGGVAVTIEQREENEAVVAYDMATGKDRWVRTYPGHFKEELGGNGPRATPTIAENEVFALGASGLLVSLDLASGQEKWQTNILQDAQATNIQWGMCGAPLVVDNKVIVNPGGSQGHSIVAYDRSTGLKLWSGGSAKAGYASPVLGNLLGQQQVIIFGGENVAGYDLADGTEKWQFPFKTFNGINVGQPLVIDQDRVFITAGYDAGSVMLQIKNENGQWTAEPLWQNKRLKCKMSSAVYLNGFLYGLDDGILACLNAQTGNRVWKSGRYGHGQILLRNDTLVIQAESGELVMVAADPERHRELTKIPVLPGDKTWNAPALIENWLLLRNHFEAVLLELPMVQVQ
jgi:outer membrane protein assembly factor BamB